MRVKKVHYVECQCGESEGNCCCDTFCGRWLEDPETTGVKKYVTCKQCQHWIPEFREKEITA